VKHAARGCLLVAVESVDGSKGIDSIGRRGAVSVLQGDPLSGRTCRLQNTTGDKITMISAWLGQMDSPSTSGSWRGRWRILGSADLTDQSCDGDQ